MTIEQYAALCMAHGQEWVARYFPRCEKYVRTNYINKKQK